MSQFPGPRKTSMKKTNSKRVCTIESTNRHTSLFHNARDIHNLPDVRMEIGAFSPTRRASNFGHHNRSREMLILNFMIMEAKARVMNEERRREVIRRATMRILEKLNYRELQHLRLVFEELLINVRARIEVFQEHQVPTLPLIPSFAPGFGFYPYGSYAYGSLGQNLGFGPPGCFDAYGNVPRVGAHPYGLGANGSDSETPFDIALGLEHYVYVPNENQPLDAIRFCVRNESPRSFDSNGFVDMSPSLRSNSCRYEKNDSNGGAQGTGGSNGGTPRSGPPKRGSNGDESSGENPIFGPPESSNENGWHGNKPKLEVDPDALMKMDMSVEHLCLIAIKRAQMEMVRKVVNPSMVKSHICSFTKRFRA